MLAALSVRSYTKTMQQHSHDFYQLVLPLNGHIAIQVAEFNGNVGVGEGICIAPNSQHHFNAEQAARFVVADLAEVPPNLSTAPSPVFQITPPLQSLLGYIEVQLTHSYSTVLQASMVALFTQLLAFQPTVKQLDPRITVVLSRLHQNVAARHTIASLAKTACMGGTQFKQRFTEATGMGLRSYLIKLRMEKARALLSQTDAPIIQVAALVGYDDVSAFTRRFTHYFGNPPKYYQRKNS
jgi:AraC-like DNA-binding protein